MSAKQKVCVGIAETLKSSDLLILVTKDLVLRLKAQILGIRAEDYTTEQITETDAGYTGRCEAYIPDELIKEFKKKGIDSELLYNTDENGERLDIHFTENEFATLRLDQSIKKTILGRISGDKVVPLKYRKASPYSVVPKNVGQYSCRKHL